MDEVVALYDDDGNVIGAADRSRVRDENLRHGATGVVVRDSRGRIYVHRRTDTKDVFPGMYDCCAGGVIQFGEEPLASATRELAEELGVTGVPLASIGTGDYRDEHTNYHAFLFTVVYDGPIEWQPDEVVWGDWVEPANLLEMLDELPFVPDTTALLREWLEHLVDDE